jgi:hypothetical protein
VVAFDLLGFGFGRARHLPGDRLLELDRDMPTADERRRLKNRRLHVVATESISDASNASSRPIGRLVPSFRLGYTSNPIARISASALLCWTTPGCMR